MADLSSGGSGVKLKTKTQESAAMPREKVARLAKLKKACADLESIFVNTLLSTMHRSVPKGGAVPQSAGSGLYESMFDQQLAVTLSKGQGLGLGQAVFNQMAQREKLSELDLQNPSLQGLRYRQTIAPNRMKKP